MTGEEQFLKKHFREYYSGKSIDSVPEVGKREFGYGVFRRKIANRNLSFKSNEEMNSFLKNEAPLFFSYSNALYKDPGGRPMKAKGLEKADIIYEFDADDLPTECKEKHDSWRCTNGHEGKGDPEKCPECGAGTEVKQWFCEECLGRAKEETFRLINFLKEDFGFEEGISVNFSGKAGYHIHIRNESIRGLGRKARIELVDYLTGNGIFFGSLGYNLSSKQLSCPTGKGLWQKRLKEGVKEYFEGSPKQVSAVTGAPLKKVRQLFESRDELAKAMDRGVLFPIPGRKSKEFWEALLYSIVEKKGLPIDRQTSVDLNKIIRVPETLHGETGLCAKTIPLSELSDFRPFEDAVVFGSEKVKVFIEKAPEFKLGGNKFGPFESEEAEVPLFCAVYLVGKGAARIA